MSRPNNLNDPSSMQRQIIKAQRILGGTAPVGHTSVNEGALRIASAEGLIVQGSQRISGSSTVSGTQTVTGTHNINGTQNINGTLKVGSITMSPTGAHGGRIAASTLDFVASTMLASGDLGVSGELLALGGLVLLNLPTTTDAANLRAGFVGTVEKVTSASRFKIDPQPMDLPDELLAIPVEAWIDRNAAETVAALWDAPRPFTRQQQAAFDGAELKRIPGVIAEKVEAAGGAEFVSYGQDGQIEGVAYDRLALARTAMLAHKLDAALERIEELTKQVEALTSS